MAGRGPNAIEHAERAREMEVLLEVAAALASTLELGPLLGVLLEQLRRVAEYTGSAIVVVEGADLVVLDDRGGPAPNRFNPEMTGSRAPAARLGLIWAVLSRGEPVIVADARSDEPLACAYRQVNADALDSPVVRNVRSLLAVPLIAQGRAIGYVHISHTEPGRFTAHHARLAMAIAHHAAAAIENARLYAESRRLAAIEERARLARDLHDSVTQSVFSAGMLADAALIQHEHGAAALPATLGRIRTVLGDALGELRTLLYELQPAALAEEGLARALGKLATSAQARTEATVTFDGEQATRLLPDTETALYRIAQEATANAVKYARASAIRLTLDEAAGRLRAVVADDGAGFDPAAPVTPSADGRRGGMGLRSMRERAAAAGLVLHVESAPGRGTRVSVEAPLGVTDAPA